MTYDDNDINMVVYFKMTYLLGSGHNRRVQGRGVLDKRNVCSVQHALDCTLVVVVWLGGNTAAAVALHTEHNVVREVVRRAQSGAGSGLVGCLVSKTTRQHHAWLGKDKCEYCWASTHSAGM